MEDIATKEKARRAYSRNQTMATVKCQPYTSDAAVRVSDGVMCNYSSEGLYIETSQNFKSDTILVVRIVSYSPTQQSMADREQPRSICLAKVKWSQRLSHENTIQFGIGMKYID
ncbi:hypothetical protein DSCW_48670 [Desulfosarcina widdelii]|uniref:PilZ domain-containing protein n=1 Tax=Desulfosarcina widdelii TaxID=947919 RepID=A0A5K7Z9K0_9BACT|nr:hypothetical protein DSCW_48670 [Desulfosarcina widdelii]